MDHLYDRLLLNTLVVVSGPLIIQLFFRDSLRGSRRWTSLGIGLVMTVDQVLCMMFPFQIIPDFRVDLRIIPMVVGSLYGGAPVALLLAFAFVVQRLLIGGPHAIMAIALYGVCIALIVSLIRPYQRLTKWYRIVFSLIPAALIALFSDIFMYTHLHPTRKVFGLLGIYTAATLLILWITIAVIEYMDENARMREEISRADKYHVLGELAASIAHEIRNPMTVARGFLQLTRESSSLDDVHKQYISTAMSEIDRAHSIINDYLSLAKPQFGQIVETDIETSVHQVVELLRPYATLVNVAVDHVVKHTATIYAAPEHVRQMLVNISKNGIEAMPGGGILSIKVICERQECVIRISDTGIGMTAEQLEQLGNPFYSTKANGTGLGMMTSYRLCQNMNGTISVDSTLGKGTEFTIRLPIVPDSAVLTLATAES